jgi:hypothetical protein
MALLVAVAVLYARAHCTMCTYRRPRGTLLRGYWL